MLTQENIASIQNFLKERNMFVTPPTSGVADKATAAAIKAYAESKGVKGRNMPTRAEEITYCDELRQAAGGTAPIEATPAPAPAPAPEPEEPMAVTPVSVPDNTDDSRDEEDEEDEDDDDRS